MRVYVSPATGPEESEALLVREFEHYIKALRDRVWKCRIDPIKMQIMKEQAGHLHALLATTSTPVPASHAFTITIDT